MISLDGRGVISVEPDMAVIILGVISENKMAHKALDENSNRMQKVIAKLKKLEIDPKDIQTTNFNLTPVWSANSSNNQRKITGYSASNSLKVIIRDLSILGGILDLLNDNAANNFQNLSFDVKDRQALEDRARVSALKDALRKAALYADTAHVTLGKIIRISEPSIRRNHNTRMLHAFTSDETLPISSGIINISATVSVEFGIDE